MKKLIIETELEVFEAVSELPKDIQELLNKAHKARENAYAPYSRFNVGAALQLATGEIVIGNNQENASFPSGLCAERVAIFQAGALYPDAKIELMAITAGSLNHPTTTPIPPCGACRQSMVEYEIKQKEPIVLYFMGATGKVIRAASVADLLPLVFDKSYL